MLITVISKKLPKIEQIISIPIASLPTLTKGIQEMGITITIVSIIDSKHGE
jgi:hypothetical protein